MVTTEYCLAEDCDKRVARTEFPRVPDQLIEYRAVCDLEGTEIGYCDYCGMVVGLLASHTYLLDIAYKKEQAAARTPVCAAYLCCESSLLGPAVHDLVAKVCRWHRATAACNLFCVSTEADDAGPTLDLEWGTAERARNIAFTLRKHKEAAGILWPLGVARKLMEDLEVPTDDAVSDAAILAAWEARWWDEPHPACAVLW